MKLFNYRALVKTQRLNITIYSGRKNNSFIALYTLNNIPMHWKKCVIYKSVINDQQFFA
jgi:hypothetical protein